ncbi:MAG TPA: serine hydrolase [Bacteroidales bacterium]|nr:MAG: serine hydrolase [Bacteroidetes bacterium GWE2_42_24]OFY25664.1 MAG: serine hydrolase [Bacteroidetes bacterium GWF2_43_11]HBZ68077.1 serine hydrolase [Bacteroidales bacterium]
MSKLSILLWLLLLSTSTIGQVEKHSALYKTIKGNDSLLFNIGFNTCDITQFENLVSENFEFYHDKTGITSSKSAFIESIRNGLCKLSYKPRRELDAKTMEVFPLEKNGVLYGAIQTGNHSFYAIENGKKEYLTSVAKFTHVWILESGNWKLSKGLSYDHKDFDKPIDENLLFTDKTETERWLKLRHIPAIGIGYIEDGKIVQVSVFGELEKDRSAPLNTIWNVASMTKPITAMVTLKLADAGKWSLDEPIYRYYIDPDVVDDPRVKKLTTRFILSHQSGFTNWRGNNADGKLAFEFEPGTNYQYSGEGFEYLRKALEKKFHKSLDELAKEFIFNPLKMIDTRFAWDETMDSTRFAKWHNEKGELYKTEKNSTINAADNLLTTVEDYCKFMVHIINGGGISKTLYEEMVAEQVRINDFKHWGLGWCIDENINTNQEFALVHGGSDIGVQTIAFIVPKTRQGLLIFTNCDNGTDAFADILVKYLKKNGEGILNIEMNHH